MTSFAFRETPVQVPTWFMGIVDKYVPEDQRALAIQDYALACRQARKPLTPRQHEIYQFIAGHISEQGYAPSLDEIAQLFGFASIATVHEHLQNLERNGWIRRQYNETRAITLVEGP